MSKCARTTVVLTCGELWGEVLQDSPGPLQAALPLGRCPFGGIVSSRALQDWKYPPACPGLRTKAHVSLCVYYFLVALRCPQLMSLKTYRTEPQVFQPGPNEYLMQIETHRGCWCWLRHTGAAGCWLAPVPYLDTRGKHHRD